MCNVYTEKVLSETDQSSSNTIIFYNRIYPKLPLGILTEFFLFKKTIVSWGSKTSFLFPSISGILKICNRALRLNCYMDKSYFYHSYYILHNFVQQKISSTVLLFAILKSPTEFWDSPGVQLPNFAKTTLMYRKKKVIIELRVRVLVLRYIQTLTYLI